MKKILEDYLSEHFPTSDLSIPFREINEKITKGINLNLYPKVNYENQKEFALNKALKIFNEIFNSGQEILILVIGWGEQITEYPLICLNILEDNFIDWITTPPEDEERRNLIVMIRIKERIKLNDLFTSIINSEFDIDPQVDNKIIFINTELHITFQFWDSCISLGFKDEMQHQKFKEYFTN